MGPVKAPQRTYTPFIAKKAPAKDEDEEDSEGDTATLGDESIGEDGVFSGDDSEAREEPQHIPKNSVTKAMATPQSESERRTKRKRMGDDLEEQYMQRLQEEEDVEKKKLEAARKAKQEPKTTPVEYSDTKEGEDGDSEDSSGTGSNSESEDDQEKKKDKNGTTRTGRSTESLPIRHETLEPQKHEDLDEAARTVFLGNVPSIAISSKVRLLAPLSCFTSNTG